MADDLTFGIRITANGDQLVGTVKESTAALDGLNASAQRAKTTAETLGISETELAARLQKNADATAAYKQKILDTAAAHKKAAEQIYVVNDAYIKNAEAAGKGAEHVKTNSTAVRESMVMMREAANGNFTRMAGSASIMANALGVMPAVLSPVGLAIGAVAGATIGMAVAFEKGILEQEAMNKALIMTGNYAGATSGSLDVLAHSAAASGGSLSEAKKAVEELAGSGKFTADQIGVISSAAAAMERATGVSVDATIKQFESLAVESAGSSARSSSAISNATLKLDDQYHFLTLAVYEQISALEKEGNAKEASRLATDEFAKATKDRAAEISANLGGIEKGWNAIKDSINGAISAVGDWGKHGAEFDVKNLTSKLNQFDIAHSDDGGASGAERLKIVNALAAAKSELLKVNAAATAQGASRLATSQAEHAAQQISLTTTQLQRNSQGELTTALKEYHAEVAKIAAVNPNDPLVSKNAVAAMDAAITKAHTQKAPKVDHITTSYNSLMKEFSNLALEAKGKTEDLTRAQIKLNEAKASAEWKSYTPKEKQNATAASITADENEKTELAAKQAKAAQKEADKISTSVKAVSDAEIANLQFKNSLIGKNTLEVMQMTEANKIDLALKKELLAIDKNTNFDTRNKGDGKAFNPQVDASYNIAVDETKKAADAAKAGSEVTIKANYDASRSWDVEGTKAIHTYMDNVNNAGLQSSQIFSQTFKNAENTLAKFYQTGKLGATDFVNMISGELAHLAAQKTMSGLGNIFSGVGGSGGASGLATVASWFGFANGGIMTSGGPMPLNAYANGGVANSPQLALFGEGRSPEAFVPLPDGRSIPVSLSGVSGGASSGTSGTAPGDININIIMNTGNGTSTSQTGGAAGANTTALSQMASNIAQVVRAQIVQEQRQGGLLAPQAA